MWDQENSNPNIVLDSQGILSIVDILDLTGLTIQETIVNRLLCLQTGRQLRSAHCVCYSVVARKLQPPSLLYCSPQKAAGRLHAIPWWLDLPHCLPA